MFERFTDRARRVVVLASEDARNLNHAYIGTEHLLLGLIHEGEGLAAKALDDVGVTVEAARERVLQVVGPGEQVPSGHMPYTPRAKKVLEFALREALGLGHNYIGTEHILLGVLREGEGVGVQVLGQLGVLPSELRKRLLALMGDKPERPAPRSGVEAVWGRLSERAASGEVEMVEWQATSTEASTREIIDTVTVRWRRR